MAAFDDKFIVDMPDDEAVAERLHSITEDVAAYSLDDILYEFRTIGFDPIPFLRTAHAFICHGLPVSSGSGGMWIRQ